MNYKCFHNREDLVFDRSFRVFKDPKDHKWFTMTLKESTKVEQVGLLIGEFSLLWSDPKLTSV